MMLRGILGAVLLLTQVRSWPVVTPRQSNDGCSINFGSQTINGARVGESCRYTVRYGVAERWGYFTVATNLEGYDSTSLPPACPQDPSPVVSSAPSQSEDCLFATVFVPGRAQQGSGLPVLVWLHGGSYLSGSASAPGLDASNLAQRGNMIVVVMQYRLGVLGHLPPALAPASANPNLALKDIITALKAIEGSAQLIGGDKDKVTVGGQSSGASLVRALLAAPEARGLFRSAIIQSDPMTYGTASLATTNRLRDAYFSSPGLKRCRDLACLRYISLAAVFGPQAQFVERAPHLVEGVPMVTPLRPTHGTPSLPSDSPSDILSFSSGPNRVPLLITTTANEAGSVTQAIFPASMPINNQTYLGVLSGFVGQERASIIASSPPYALPASGQGREDEFRQKFERLVTDGVWRCASRDFARRWAGAGGNVWVGEWTRGRRYVSNEGGSYCTGDGVCHEDDIIPTLQSGSSGDSSSSSFQDDVLRRWSSFIHNQDPNLAPALPNIGGNRNTNIALPPSSGGIVSPPRQPFREPGKDGSRFFPTTPQVGGPPLLPGSGPASGVAPAIRPGVHIGRNTPEDACSGDGEHERDVKELEGRQQSIWEKFTGQGGEGQVYAIGGGQVGTCPDGFWGEQARFDWQMFA